MANNFNNPPQGRQSGYFRSQRSSQYTTASRYSLTNQQEQDEAFNFFPGAVGVAQPLGFQPQPLSLPPLPSFASQFDQFAPSSSHSPSPVHASASAPPPATSPDPFPVSFSGPYSGPSQNDINNNSDFVVSPTFVEPYSQAPVSPIESNYSIDRRSLYRKSQQSQYSTYSRKSVYSRKSTYTLNSASVRHSQHPMPYRMPSTYAQERGYGIQHNDEDTGFYAEQSPYDAARSDQYSDEDTKKSHFSEDIVEVPAPVVPQARPQRHPHYYVPPVLRFYTLLIVFLISIGLVGLTEVGMRKLPHAAKSEKISPSHLASALSSKAAMNSTMSSGLMKRAPQTKTTTNKPATTTESVNTAPFQTTQVQPTTQQQQTTPQEPVRTTQQPATLPVESYVPTTQPQPQPTTNNNANANTNTNKDSSASTLADSQANSLTLTNKISTTAVTSVPSNRVTTDANGQETTIVVLVASTSTGTTPVETTVSTGRSTSDNKKSIFTPNDTFVGNSYMVLIIAVAFKQFWSAIYSQSKLMDPFTQMNREEGAPANRIMSMFYLSTGLLPDGITAIMNGRWFILWNSLVYLAVGALAPVSSEMLFLNTKYLDCPNITDNINNPCWPPRLTIDPIISRAVQGILVFIAVTTLIIAILVHRMRTGVYADPSSIGAVAALTHHPEVLQDFRALSDEATSRDVAEFISTKHYKLDDYMRPDGSWRYGIVPVNPSGQPGYRSIDEKRSRFDATPKTRQWRRWDMFFDILFLSAILALLGIVAGYFVTGNDTSYNRFFSTMTFGPRFVLTGTGTLIAVNWRRLERDAHTLAPFNRMSKAPAEPLSTILLRKSSIPLTAIIPMFTKRYFVASFIAAIALLSEALVIFLGAVPYAPGQVYVELLVSAYMSMCTLGIMAIALIVLMVWKANLPDLPRAPNTLASMVTYVAESRMQEDFQTAEWFDDRELIAHFSALDKRYIYGKHAGTDGEYRHLVDEQPPLLYS